ncbi:cytoplasmic polyadenylation element-binding protein 2-like isoform X1 [Coregonus clupeaformis]|uniref:cytoplasmic polyadenylation element-binding protein 2-like isoform X1 n=1 Tax=Coregonus clupeaformis TaxID=59861 RepID=UPI001E1C78CD|nr:cytoplasmic polyadenylation element-binding protein 2-like isoform X1 [Coregonus clupeaformis]
MQDEPVGVTTEQRPPPTEEKYSNNNTINKTGKQQPNQTNNQLGALTSNYNHLIQNPEFTHFGQDHFCPTQSIFDLQHDGKIHQLAEFGCTESPLPQGKFRHLPQRQPFTAQVSTKPERSADSSPGRISGSPVEEVEADVETAASPSPTSVNPNKVKIQMDSPITHHINNGNGSGTGNMLAGGLGGGFPNLQNQEMQNPSGGSASPPLHGFGTPWSVQTSSPPPVSNSANPIHHANAINQMAHTDPDNSFYPGIPSSINPAFFQSFSPVSANPCPGINVQGFSSPFSPQINALQQPQQSRRSPVSPQMHPQHQQGVFLQQRNNYNHHHQPMVKQSPWGGSHQGSGWSSGGMSWGRDHRRGGGMGILGSVSQVSPMKKPFSSNVIAPPKFPRSAGPMGPKAWIEENMFRTDSNINTLMPLQDRSRMYDSLNMHSLESSLIDIMRAEQDPMKGRVGCPHPGADGLLMLNARSYGRRRGRSSLFPIEDSLLDDGHGNQGVPGLGPNCYPHPNGERIERFSRKVFVGGLPPDIDEDEITNSFRRFGHLVVDWPHKAESKSYFPPKGYAFLLFQEESSVQALIEACMEEDGKLYLCVSSPTIKDKPVQIRPWNLSDSDFVMDGSQPLDPRKTIFVGGVPRPLRAVELAMIMDRLYGGVCYAGIDTDPELKYPKGAGRVAFSNQQSYIAAISARFVQLQHGDIDKRVEVKPYVLDDQLCDECQGARCGGKFAPFFCANVTCLQYYCEFCWANIHSRAGREFHKPLVKEGADRPRQIHFRWN